MQPDPYCLLYQAAGANAVTRVKQKGDPARAEVCPWRWPHKFLHWRVLCMQVSAKLSEVDKLRLMLGSAPLVEGWALPAVLPPAPAQFRGLAGGSMVDLTEAV